MKIISFIAAVILLICTGTVQADLMPGPPDATVTGPEATNIANNMLRGMDKDIQYVQGKANVSCIKKDNKKHFTCVVKLTPDSK